MTDYTPVDCGLHSEYELAIIMHRDNLKLTWRDANGETCSDTITPTDLRTRNSEEFLVVSGADGMEFEIRLDRILHCSRI